MAYRFEIDSITENYEGSNTKAIQDFEKCGPKIGKQLLYLNLTRKLERKYNESFVLMRKIKVKFSVEIASQLNKILSLKYYRGRKLLVFQSQS